MRRWPQALLRGVVHLYRWTLSPLLGPACRFQPTCSVYALAVLQTEPLGRALSLIARRLGRCHPFHPGGIDLPPAGTDDVVAASVLAPAPRTERGS